MLEDPRINFAISTRGSKVGVDHLGIQTDTEEELAALKEQAEAADMTLLDVGETTCCYARSDKYWLTDPQGIALLTVKAPSLLTTWTSVLSGGEEEDRTPDLRIANATLSQLSYPPTRPQV